MRAYEIITEHEMVFSRAGNKLKTKWRCTTGARSGRVVGNAKDCDKPIDQKRRAQMKVTRKTKAKQAARKSAKTKRVNPASKLLGMLNKMRKASVTSGGKENSLQAAKEQSQRHNQAKKNSKDPKVITNSEAIHADK